MDRLLEYIQNHPWLVAAAVLTAVMVLVFELQTRRRNFAAVSPQDLIRLQNQGALLLDLRTPEQYASGHIAGARRLDSAEILKAGETFRKYKEKPVVVYCDTGSTGSSAARVLAGQGFTKAFNLRNGLGSWRTENLPLTKGSEKG